MELGIVPGQGLGSTAGRQEEASQAQEAQSRGGCSTVSRLHPRGTVSLNQGLSDPECSQD